MDSSLETRDPGPQLCGNAREPAYNISSIDKYMYYIYYLLSKELWNGYITLSSLYMLWIYKHIKWIVNWLHIFIVFNLVTVYKQTSASSTKNCRDYTITGCLCQLEEKMHRTFKSNFVLNLLGRERQSLQNSTYFMHLKSNKTFS